MVAFRNTVRFIIAAIILFFLYRLFVDNISELDVTEINIKWEYILTSYVFAMTYYLLNIYSWKMITGWFDIELPFKDTMKVWLYSQLGKYLPGKVWLFIGRVQAYSTKGKSRTLMAGAFFIEMATRFLAGIILFLLTWGTLSVNSAGWPAVSMVMVVAIGLLVFLHPRVFKIFFNLFHTAQKKQIPDFSLSLKHLMNIFFIEMIAWIAGGIGLACLIHPTFPLQGTEVFQIGGALAIAGILGLVALFVPSGLGVREGVMVFFLKNIMPISFAVATSILARLWITSAELFLISITYLATRWNQR